MWTCSARPQTLESVKSVTWLDFLLIGLVLLSTGISFWRGFLRETASLISIIAALAAAATGYEWAGRAFEGLTQNQEIARGIGFLLLFFGVLVLGSVIAILLRKLVKEAQMTGYDRFFGGVFGLLRGVLVGSVLLLAMLAFKIKSDTAKISLLTPYFLVGARAVVLVMPEDVKTKFQEGYDKFREIVAEPEKIRKKLN